MPDCLAVKIPQAVLTTAFRPLCSLRTLPYHHVTSAQIRGKEARQQGRRLFVSGAGRQLSQGQPQRATERQADQPQTDRDLINTSSLSRTLEAHRQANEKGTFKREKIAHGLTPPKYDHGGVYMKKVVLTRDSPAPSKARKKEPQRNQRPRMPSHQMEDYQAQVQPLSADWQVTGTVARYLRLPWMRSIDKTTEQNMHSHTRLAAEIMAADKHYGPTALEADTAKEVFNEISEFLLKNHGPKLQTVDLIGSRAAGHALCTADMDMNLVLASLDKSSEKSLVSRSNATLKEVYRSLRAFKSLVVSTYVQSARVPIVMGYHRETGLAWQMQCSDSCYGSLGLMKSHMAEFPLIRPLFRVLQHMLKIRGLVPHHVGARGISSYPLLTMIAVSLKIHSRTSNGGDVAEQLLNFLDFWSKLDTYSQGIAHMPNPQFGLTVQDLMRSEEYAVECISRITQDPVGAVPFIFNPGQAIPPFHQKHTPDDYHLVLYDPANPFNDLGYRLAPIKHAQATFREIHAALKIAMAEWDKQRVSAPDIELKSSLLAPVLEADHTLWNLERKKLTRTGLDDFLGT